MINYKKVIYSKIIRYINKQALFIVYSVILFNGHKADYLKQDSESTNYYLIELINGSATKMTTVLLLYSDSQALHSWTMCSDIRTLQASR